MRAGTSEEYFARLREIKADLEAEEGVELHVPAWWGVNAEEPATEAPAEATVPPSAAPSAVDPLEAGPSASPSAGPSVGPSRRLLLLVGVGSLDQHFTSKRLPILLRAAKQSKRFAAVRPLYTCKLDCCRAAVTPPLPAGEVTHLVIGGEAPPSDAVPLALRKARALVARSEAPAAVAAHPPASLSRYDKLEVEARFACQAPIGRVLRNVRLAKPLEEMAVIFKKCPSEPEDQFRALVYGKTAKLLFGWRKEIETDADLEELMEEVNGNTPRLKLPSNQRLGTHSLGPRFKGVARQILAAVPGSERAANNY
ncbi:hypothetical protein T492DRAFT_884758 [Pavlovales sp. CCMP2436]|nr:hypothetical protein T492DRAFT_884758 [Pavlovales sp. CCMP2436]